MDKVVADVQREIKEAQRLVRALWVKRRYELVNKHGSAYLAFTDARSLDGLKRAVERAWTYVEYRDIEKATLALAENPKGNPWYLDEEARQQYRTRCELETLARKMEERRQEDRMTSPHFFDSVDGDVPVCSQCGQLSSATLHQPRARQAPLRSINESIQRIREVTHGG